MKVELTEPQIRMLLTAASYYTGVWNDGHNDEGEADGDLADTNAVEIKVLKRAMSTLQDIEDEDEADDDRPLLEGEINIGDRFIWEPNKPHAHERVEVTDIKVDIDGELRIWTRRLDRPMLPPCWNEESRFRQACVRL